MIFGTPEKERIQINEETLWGGSPYSNNNPNALAVLDTVRGLIFQDKPLDAEQIINANFYTKTHGMPYQTVGSLYLTFDGHEHYKEYYRDLNIEDAIATTKYNVNGVNFKREIFSSLDDNLLMVKITADQPGALNFTAGFESPLNDARVFTEKKRLILTGRGSDHEGIEGKIKMQTALEIRNKGGKVFFGNDEIGRAS